MDANRSFRRILGLVGLVAIFLGAGTASPGQEWDETGVDWPVPEIPDVGEATPAVAKARSVARALAREMGATEEQAEQAAFAVPDAIAEWKSPLQLAFEEHQGQVPTDVDPAVKPPRTVQRSVLSKTVEKKAIAAGKRVLGWHPYWATMTDIENYEYSNLTTIAYFSYAVNSTNGGYDSIGSWNTSPVVEWAHSNGVKVVLTATLFGDTATRRLLTNATACSNLVNNLLTVVTNRGGDGVCIDFEGVGSWSGATAALTTFMSNLTTRFHAANPAYEVSIALPSVDWYANFAVSNYAAFGLDYAIIMGYDYYYSGSGTPGPVAPLYSSAQWIGASSWCSVNYSMNTYLSKGISTNKLMLGVPYYGRRWAAASTNLGAASLGSSYSTALTYGQSEAEAAKWGKKWDNNGSVPYYTYTSNSMAYQCFYDDATSLGLKYDLSNAKGMGGIGIWNLTQGAGQSALWSLIDDKFGAGASTPVEPDPGDTGGGSATAPWTNRVSAHSANFYGVASRAGLHVASGAGGAIYTSTNGIQWTARSSGKSGLLMNVNGDGPLWVVVGEGGAIVTSTNGTDWAAQTSPTNALFRGVAYGNGIYVACGDNGAIVRSTNGTTWTSVASGTNLSLQGVGYGMDFVNAGETNETSAESPLFVIVGQSGLILTSSNGLSWTPRTSGTTVYISDVMYGNGYYVAVGSTRTLRSSDGMTWSFATNAAYLYRAAYCSGVFKTTGKNGAIWSSVDGLTWEAETSGTTNDIRGISYANDQFVAVGFNGTILTKGTMGSVAAGDEGDEEGGGGGETEGGDEPVGTPDETGLPQVSAAQPTGPLSGVVVYTSGGHGFGANEALTAWIPERPLLYAVNEDMGNVDQLNRFAESAWKAGATVVPFRPVGYQTNEVVLDNMDTNWTARGQVTFGGTWYNSTQSIYYGNSGDAVPYRYASISTNGSTSWASYRPNLPEAGSYPVYTWVRHGSDRANQLYRVYHSGGVTDVRVNHRDVGCGWVWLGNYHFAAGTNGCVNIGNYVPGGAEGTSVFADGIRFGNGRGAVSRGTAGLSGFEQDLESSRFWTIKSMGQGMDSTLYDLAGYDDRSDNIGQPARMAAYMCRSNDASRWRRVYVGFHSNASGSSSNTTVRGAVGLYDTRIQSSYPTYYAAQTNLAAALARQCNVDLRAGTNSVIPSWSTRTSYLYGGAYGEIYNSSVFLKMDTTINEVAYHDHADDCTVLKTPAGREWLARATTRGLVYHLSTYYASGIVNTNAPDRPINLRAVNSGSGAVTVSWAMPARDGASGGLPQGFVLYTSTDGRGFGNPISVSGASATNRIITNLNAGATIFFRVCATNAGGESLDSAVAGVRVTAGGARAGVLVVDGFKRNDAGLAPTRYFANGLNGQVTLVRPRMINSFDYVKEHGSALAAAGQTFDSVDATLVTAALLTNYAKVVWMLGEESTVNETFSSAEQTAVTSYLNAGGRLLVSGAEIGWDLGRAGVSSTADVNFFTNVLRAAYASDSGGTGQVTGTAGGFLSGVSIGFNYTNLLADTYAANWPDVLSAKSGAVTAAVYGASAGGASGAVIQYSNATYRTIVMGFPFETITNEATRATVMTKAMQFLGDSATPGAIRVTLSPTAVTNAARWVVNGTTNLSGVARTGLNPGTYQVTYGAVAGYTAPAATSVVVVAGATNVLTATYAAAAGSLTVTLQPATAVADGRWSIDGGGVWRTSGTTLANLTNGTYAVTFQDIDSHTPPAATNVTISGGAVSVTGAYAALVGDLTVTLTPAAAVANGAAWSVDGGATWRASGATATGLLAGRQYYAFRPATGYTAPSTSYTTVTAGTNSTRSYAYTALPGSITVTLAPAEAVAAGAMWSLDGGTNWNESGATVQDLAVKTYAISFRRWRATPRRRRPTTGAGGGRGGQPGCGL
jgi:spore germination protein YaaH